MNRCFFLFYIFDLHLHTFWIDFFVISMLVLCPWDLWCYNVGNSDHGSELFHLCLVICFDGLVLSQFFPNFGVQNWRIKKYFWQYQILQGHEWNTIHWWETFTLFATRWVQRIQWWKLFHCKLLNEYWIDCQFCDLLDCFDSIQNNWKFFRFSWMQYNKNIVFIKIPHNHPQNHFFSFRFTI